MAGTLERRSPPLVVDLRRRDVSMTKQLLDLGNVDAEIQQPGGTRRPQAGSGVLVRGNRKIGRVSNQCGGG